MNYQLCYNIFLEVLANPLIPDEDKKRFQSNLDFAKENLDKD